MSASRHRTRGNSTVTVNLVVFGCVLVPFVFVAVRAIYWLLTH